jgi:hypothetical protein
VEGSNAQNLIKVITDTLVAISGLTKVEVPNRLLCFGANGVNIVYGVVPTINILSLVYFLVMWFNISLCAQLYSDFTMLINYRNQKVNPKENSFQSSYLK